MDAHTERWTSPDGAKLAQEVIRRLAAGKRIDRLGLNTYEGRTDLRGIVFPLPQSGRRLSVSGFNVALKSGTVEIRRARWEGIDLSRAQLREVLFYDSTVSDCRFDGADCRGLSVWDTTIASSNFSGADLRDTHWGPGVGRPGTIWRDLDFRRADLRKVILNAVTIDRCDFTDARLDGLHFRRCALAACTFAGRLYEVVFDGRDWGPDVDGKPRPAPTEMRQIDLRGAQMELVEFKGYRLDDVTLPDGVYVIRRYRAVASRALELLAKQPSDEAKVLSAVLENSLRGPFRDEDAAVFNRRDWLDLGGVGSVAQADLASEVFAQAITDIDQAQA